MSPSTTRPAAWSAAERSRFGEGVTQLREAQNLTQKRLAEQLNAAPSWVSQVESGAIPPSGSRLASLLVLLGPGLRQYMPTDGAEDSQVDEEAAAFACLWRARADLLAQLANAATDNRARRLRLYGMSRDLLSAASLHPKALPFVHQGNLDSLPEIAEFTPAWVRRIVFAELVGMKLDAPYETGFSKSRRLQYVDVIANDLGLDDEAFAATRSAFEAFERRRARPVWQDLASVGGGAGTARAAVADPSGGLALLLGHDPAGWLGIEFAAGAWLVRNADAAFADAASSDGSDDSDLEKAALVGGIGGAGLGAVLASGAAVAGSVVLGPVLGAAVGAMLGRAAATNAFQRRAAASSTDRPSAGVQDERGQVDDRAKTTATFAECLGRHWVRVEACKLFAFYRAFGEGAEALDAGRLPTRDAAVTHLRATATVIEDALDTEAKVSGTKSHDQNERLRELADIFDTLEMTAKLLGTG